MSNNMNLFKLWFESIRGDWYNEGLTKVTCRELLEIQPKQYHIDIDSDKVFGHIAYYESNGIYWVEFDAINYDEVRFYKYIEFQELPDMSKLEIEFIEFYKEGRDLGD